MQHLSELVNLVTRKKLMKLSILGKTKQSKLDELYLLFAEGTVSTDNEAAAIMYAETSSYPAYQKLKSKLKHRLVTMLFLVDQDQEVGEDAALAYEEAWRLWSSANLMLVKGAVSAGLDQAEQALALALRFEHVDLVMQITKVLRKTYAAYYTDEDKFNYYHHLYQAYEDISKAEAKVEEYYGRLMLLAVNEVSNSQEIATLGKALFAELAPMLETYQQFSIHRFIRSIQLTYLLNIQAYEETIQASQEAIDFFSSKPMNLRSTLTGLLSHQLVCYTQLKDYENGRDKLKECQAVIGNDYTRSYFKVRELGVVLFLHSKHYQEAYQLTYQTVTNKKLAKQNLATTENWKITQAYLHYLIFIGQVEPKPEDEVFTRFRLGKFLNEVPVFSKDKRGMNIPILILQVLFNIALKRYDQVFDRSEAIEKYTTRYIRKDDHYRSNCFIKMLLQIPNSGFSRRAAEKAGQKYRVKMDVVPLEIANQPHEVEIIPYEDLWEFALASLS